MRGGCLLLLAVMINALMPLAQSAVPISSLNTLFGTAIKNGPLPPKQELTTFQHNCTSAPCTVTQIHVPSIYPSGTDAFNWENGRLRVYVDDAVAPSIDISLLELAHVGAQGAVNTLPPADGSPFGNDLFGKTARTGGVYSTMRIPFQKSIRTTIQAPPSATGSSTYWFIIRGIEAMPITLGSELQLPDQASLHMWRNANATVMPLDYIRVASSPDTTAGAIVSMMFDGQSSDFNFLEACVRLYLDPQSSAKPLFLSSGTEDMFLSASYYDEGMFKTSQSGVTYTNGSGGVAMFKRFDSRDYILFHTGFNMSWRNNEDGNCPTAWGNESPVYPVNASPPLRSGTAPATYNTIVFFYSWPSNNNNLTFGGKPLRN